MDVDVWCAAVWGRPALRPVLFGFPVDGADEGAGRTAVRPTHGQLQSPHVNGEAISKNSPFIITDGGMPNI
jgi:hypothetical protein